MKYKITCITNNVDFSYNQFIENIKIDGLCNIYNLFGATFYTKDNSPISLIECRIILQLLKQYSKLVKRHKNDKIIAYYEI